MANETTPNIEYYPFVIDETDYCVWDLDGAKHNLQFINSIDPTYFEHIAAIYSDQLQGDNRQYAAIALRTAYSQGLESLFALLGATVQAPGCVVGWLLKYQNKELRNLVRKITNRKRVFTRFKNPQVTWDSIAEFVLLCATDDTQKYKYLHKSFASLWRQLASQFLDDLSTHEYNSIKHGLRVHIGGFSLTVGAEVIPCIHAPPENMRLIGKSEYGTSFYWTEQVGKGSKNFSLTHHSINWEPEKLVQAINLISMSIGNVLSYLKIVNGTPPSEVQFSWPTDEDYFHEVWKGAAGARTLTKGSTIDSQAITPLTKDEILASYPSYVRDRPQD